MALPEKSDSPIEEFAGIPVPSDWIEVTPRMNGFNYGGGVRPRRWIPISRVVELNYDWDPNRSQPGLFAIVSGERYPLEVLR